MTEIIEGVSYMVYLTPITAKGNDSRSEREQAASRRLLSTVFGEKAMKGHHADGAPFIVGREDIPISISHSSSTFLLAVGKTGCRIGADIESARPQLERVKSKFLTADESQRKDRIKDADAGMDFLAKCWTAKEAVYKTARTPGLGLTEIEVSADFSRADARENRYTLSYHSSDTGETICVATAIK